MTPPNGLELQEPQRKYEYWEYDPKYPVREEPMEGSIQRRWIETIEHCLRDMFENQPEVHVAADMAWFPREDEPGIVLSPDVMVIFGRPNTDRRSYRQWCEDDVPPKVVFEILSDSNDPQEMQEKFNFYEEYGADEYYVYDPYEKILNGYRRIGDELMPIRNFETYRSESMGITFRMENADLVIRGPDGNRFLTLAEKEADRKAQKVARAEAERQVAAETAARIQAERQAADEATARRQAEIARMQAEAARMQAEANAAQAEAARMRAEAARMQAEAARMQAEANRKLTEVALIQAEETAAAEAQARRAEEKARQDAEKKANARLEWLRRLRAGEISPTDLPEDL